MLMKSEHRKELVSEIRSLAQSQGLNTVFTTFLEITANSLAAQTDPENAEKREQRYQEMASTMTPELLSSYARMLALLFLTVREYRDDPCDILGGIYHELNLNNEWNGQYFTPDDVCRLMAQITLPSDELSAKDGPITINEPTCGSGTMVIGAIWAMQRKEFDYRHNTFFVAQDIDIRCVWMAYIQLSLYVMIVRKDSPVLIPILMTQSSTVDIRDMPGATWRDVVAAVLEQCKEPVALSFLYEQIEPHKKAQANKWWKEKIRQTLQINPMHFTHDGRGLWSLNRNAA